MREHDTTARGGIAIIILVIVAAGAGPTSP